ncbi:SusC/RagA family TonB-linked outer membrane protein [Sphingobacterium haloxyli]|uniref:SusC/RagA family TonB-linked outer membrane protein n=1 Tax=Sphingobacterium haloxyli TaxID=2100533 RepID=A0A2S9J8S7_9SPHI|nr:TonB-dependent receptor [Sphingobacterium haloxyli]PRD49205.1 SusC/RagA family TonB-linked outer membrane protein [Sphingobacterium haloxyli]
MKHFIPKKLIYRILVVVCYITCSILYTSLLSAQAQTSTVSGRVTDELTNEAIPNATVSVKGSTIQSSTDVEGVFRIDATQGQTLVITTIGYLSKEVPVTGTQINITLIQDERDLEEVVVVGYGTQRRRDVTGAISRVSGEELQERPVQNISEALQGKAAGVNVASNIRPGETPSIRIRGNRSLTAQNDPLIVVDGIPLVGGSLGDISPNDIESLDVLKDASATAIYGSRAANGVILVTTKRGKAGQVTAAYRGTATIDRYRSLTDWMNGGQYIDRWREGLMNGGLYETVQFKDGFSPVVMGYPDPFEDESRMGLAQDIHARNNVWKGYEWEEFGTTVKMRPTTAAERAMGWPAEVPVYNSANIPTYDWVGDVTRPGVTQNHQVSLSSGTEKSRIYASIDYFDQQGVLKDQDYERFNINLNGDITATDWLTFGASILASTSLQNYGISTNTSNTGSKNLLSRALDQFPYATPKDPDGNWILNPGGNLQLFNPVMDIDQVKNERKTYAISPTLFSEVQFLPWLKYRFNFGAQFRNWRAGAWTGPGATNHLNNRPNTAGYTNEQRFSWVAENLLYVDQNFGEDHRLNVTLLQSAQREQFESTATNVIGTVYDISYWYDLAANSNGRPNGYGTGFSERTLMSYMGRVNYGYKGKYLITATGRYDGASVLAPGHKWHFYPSVALAWNVMDENFMQNVSWLNELKLRGGYGVTGNSAVNPYTSGGPLSRNPYVFGENAAIGYLPQLVRNPLLGWEQTAQYNVGIDFNVLNNRVSGSLEFYQGNTSDLLLTRSLPPVSGYVEKLENIGKTLNRGFEITLNTVNIQKEHFTWSTSINWNTNHEEIVELQNGKQDMLAQRWFIGQPLQVFYQLDNAGIWQGTPEDIAEMGRFNENGHDFYPGTVRLVDQNGDYRITADDMVIRGTNRPKWSGGITNTFRYKDLTLSTFIYARWGQTFFGGYPNSYGGIWPNGRVENDLWSWDNPGGRWPQASNLPNRENTGVAMQFHDGSFVSVRNISLTYDLPKVLLTNRFVKGLQLNAQVLNPFIFGKDAVKMGYNPDDDTNWERSSGDGNPLGGSNNNTILPQSYVLSIRANF